jgi:hypothetical protein
MIPMGSSICAPAPLSRKAKRALEHQTAGSKRFKMRRMLTALGIIDDVEVRRRCKEYWPYAKGEKVSGLGGKYNELCDWFDVVQAEYTVAVKEGL